MQGNFSGTKIGWEPAVNLPGGKANVFILKGHYKEGTACKPCGWDERVMRSKIDGINLKSEPKADLSGGKATGMLNMIVDKYTRMRKVHK